jgi:DNA-binding response OmpR family regulator
VNQTLAIIEPDAPTAEKLRETFEAAGFRTDCFRDGATALSTLRTRSFALAILDLTLGFDICTEVSRIVPLVTVTTDAREETCVRALQSGADDCVCRAVPERELIARVRNVLRRASADCAPHELEELTISLAEMRVRNGNTTHELSRGEAELLRVLLEQAPRPLTPLQLAEILETPRATIESRIKSLRRKIGPQRLVTQGRLGYHLEG